MFSSLLASTTSGGSSYTMIIWIVVLFVIIWFMMLRPQKKQEKLKKAMLETMETGDTVLTNSGFYGTLIDVSDDTVIVEFGNNKNCRIPMQKSAIAEVEKASEAVADDTTEEK
ncbi:preprotein translocase subunit YajC [Eubacterium oxidoreducens]|uniref:Preprotein translocase subunit YajC n=1 Tax=Eubacterium oxidoreducens TaxID=1732 RepID=A0A1G6AXJ4_EUBOX|nr:preprotein translocase subunit YajC [Eubacterium oxidoreducens]SDB13127.1 preprotein translocase subunit YajC [Eubacterium oxidoreducens]